MNSIPRSLAFLILALCIATPLRAAEKAAAAKPAPADAANERVAAIFAGGTPEGVADLKAMEAAIRELAKRVTPMTVGVRVGSAQGSGVIVSADGYVMTAGHVVGRPDQDVQFILHDGRTVKGKTLGMDRGIDSGMMKIDGDGPWPFAELGSSKEIKPGQWCLATGHPGGYIRGRPPVLRVGRILTEGKWGIRTDCTLVGGDSGGPLFDMQGKIIGIHSRIGENLSSNVHVPVSTYSDTWDRLVAGEAWGPIGGRGPFIGVSGDPENDKPDVRETVPGGPADKAGVKAGDVITKFNGEEIDTFSKLAELVRKQRPGNKVKIEVKRGEETLTLEVEIGRRGR